MPYKRTRQHLAEVDHHYFATPIPLGQEWPQVGADEITKDVGREEPSPEKERV